jgi:hypothetical protein
MTPDSYKLPLGLTEGVDVPIGNEGIVFTILLPANTNEDFTTRLISSVSMKLDGDAAANGVQMDPGAYMAKRKELFFNTCILKAKNLPDGMNHGKFLKTNPIYAMALFEVANELATAADEAVTEAIKKLKPTLNGRASGVTTGGHTTLSSLKGSASAPNVPN